MIAKFLVRGGFTLIEIIVALMILAVLIGAIYPVVITTIRSSESGGASQELSSLRTAFAVFVANTTVCPGDLEDLLFRLDGSDRDLNEAPFSSGAVQRWTGPYASLDLEEGGEATGTSKTMANGGSILTDVVRFDTEANGESVTGNFAALEITGLTGARFDELNDNIDGASESPSRNQGRLRFKQPPTIVPDLTVGVTYFLIYPCAL